jgi:osmotically-inducible protein OsmY
LLASEPALENEEDAAITSLVKESLLFHLLINSRTDTSHGMVTLSGRADNIAEKELGTSLASAIPGVKRVVNHMVIPATLAGNGR